MLNVMVWWLTQLLCFLEVLSLDLSKNQIIQSEVPFLSCSCNDYKAKKAVQGNWLRLLQFNLNLGWDISYTDVEFSWFSGVAFLTNSGIVS